MSLMKYYRRWTSLGCIAVLSFSSVSASAQTANDEAAALFSLLSTTVVLPLTTTAGIALIIVLVVNNNNKNGRAVLQRYLEDNKFYVHATLHTGDRQSDGAQDLAQLFGVSPQNEEAFAALLYEDRDLLMPLVEGESISEDQAFAFGLHVATRMQAHPELGQDVQFHLDRYAAER